MKREIGRRRRAKNNRQQPACHHTQSTEKRHAVLSTAERERERERERESIPLFSPIPWLRCVLQHAASVSSPSSHHRQQKNIVLRVSWLFSSLLLNLVRVLLGKLRKAGTTSGSCLWRSGTRRLSDLSAGSDWPRAGVRLMFFVVHTKSESPGDFQIL